VVLAWWGPEQCDGGAARPGGAAQSVRLAGLDPEAAYRDAVSGQRYHGAVPLTHRCPACHAALSYCRATGLNDEGVTVGFFSTMNTANMTNNNFGFYKSDGSFHEP